MESNLSLTIKNEIINALTNFVMFRIVLDIRSPMLSNYLYDLYSGKYFSSAEIIPRYYTSLFIDPKEEHSFIWNHPSTSIKLPPFVDENILLVKYMALYLYLDWLFENYPFQSSNMEITDENLRQANIIQCHNLIEGWWDEYLSYFIDIDKLACLDPEINYGQIKWFEYEKGYGVIETEGKEYFIHQSNILCKPYDLSLSKLVKFNVRTRKKDNREEAYNASIVGVEDLQGWLKISNKTIEGYFPNYCDHLRLNKLSFGEQLFLRKKPNNSADTNLIIVETKTGESLGYITDPERILANNMELLGGCMPAWITENTTTIDWQKRRDTNNFRNVRRINISFPIGDFYNDGNISVLLRVCEKYSNSTTNQQEPNDSTKDSSNYWYSNFRVSPSQQEQSHNEIITNVAGVTFEGRQSIVAQLEMGEIIILKRDPSNYYDKNAIMVLRTNGEQIGYINRKLAVWLAIRLDQHEKPVHGTVKELTGDYSSGLNLGVVIKFTLPNDDVENSEGNY